ncbi:hypothetical protein [Herbidospora cretacea]|uniref:hypothetical protein n=1 Tax=Herbidospora cretacea TaxID=28444 RepID=UPI000774BF56|nr:hypothetical protein [Herbidospora cretacea]
MSAPELDVDDLFADDPMTRPLTYPGRIPPTSGLFADGRYTRLDVVDGEPAEAWVLETDLGRLGDHLDQLGVAPMSERHRVIAVGSNAAPSQLHRKFVNHDVRPVIPLTIADVTGIAPGVSAHINRNGYIPAAPIVVPGETSRLFVLWLDEPQFEILDATEPNYDRRLLPLDDFPVVLTSGVPLQACYVYVGKHGYLSDEAGQALRLTEQRALITRILGLSTELRRLCGSTVPEFLTRVQDATVREDAYEIFRLEGWARSQPEFSTIEPTDRPLLSRKECASGSARDLPKDRQV